MKIKTFKSKIELGALTNVPAYEYHHRGKNWLAKIFRDPSAELEEQSQQ